MCGLRRDAVRARLLVQPFGYHVGILCGVPRPARRPVTSGRVGIPVCAYWAVNRALYEHDRDRTPDGRDFTPACQIFSRFFAGLLCEREGAHRTPARRATCARDHFANPRESPLQASRAAGPQPRLFARIRDAARRLARIHAVSHASTPSCAHPRRFARISAADRRLARTHAVSHASAPLAGGSRAPGGDVAGMLA